MFNVLSPLFEMNRIGGISVHGDQVKVVQCQSEPLKVKDKVGHLCSQTVFYLNKNSNN